MKVIVDGEPTDEFGRPDNDQTVGDFIDHINRNLSKNNRAIGEARIDGEIATEENREKKCGSVETLELEISTLEELTINSIGQLGSYCHRFLERVPDIVSDWQELSTEKVDEYRSQVVESLSVASRVLNSIDALTNLGRHKEERNKMAKRAEELRDELVEGTSDRVRELLQGSIREYFENLLETLQDALDQIEERRENLLEDVQNIGSVVDNLHNEIKQLIDDAQQKSDSIDEWFDIERIREATSQLTEINQVLDKLDQSGKLKAAFEVDELESIKKTREELREGVARVFSLLEDRDPTEIAKTLRTDIEPYLNRVRGYFEALSGEQDESEPLS